MDVKLLIDAIMRQTTILIAQLSTSAGIRAPLAHVADQVFLELASEIEAQGVSRKVAADMFGLALRSYQKKVRRLTESKTEKNQTLWEAVLDFLSEAGSTTRDRVLQRFVEDEERDVAAVLNDLVGQGFLYSSGRGAATLYGPTSEADRARLASDDAKESLLQMAWLSLYRKAMTRPELVQALSVDPARLEEVIERLLADGHVSEEHGTLRAETYLVPVGAERGWEAAVFDHLSAVSCAIASKLANGRARSEAEDVVGGATLTFEITATHPLKDEVQGLLKRIRHEVNDLWQRVGEANDASPPPEDEKIRVTFYLGQNVVAENGGAS